MDNNLHLFIIWDQSRNKSEEIINDITSKFIIREIFEISWNKKNFLNNLIRFYGHSLPDPKKKTLLCGTGPFLLIIVQDRNPNFRTGIVYTAAWESRFVLWELESSDSLPAQCSCIVSDLLLQFD